MNVQEFACPECGGAFGVDPMEAQQSGGQVCCPHCEVGMVLDLAALGVEESPVETQQLPVPDSAVLAARDELAVVQPPPPRSKPSSLVGSALGNTIWVIFGGFPMALTYWICGFVMCLTIIGIGSGIKFFKLANYTLMPFGKVWVEHPSGCLTQIGNVFWLLTTGWAVALAHCIWGGLLLVPVVTLPFAIKHFEIAHFSLMPGGKELMWDDDPRLA